MAHAIKRKFGKFLKTAGNLGFFGACVFYCQVYLGLLIPCKRPYCLKSRYALYPLAIRPATSDVQSFGQIFVEDEYAVLDVRDDLDLIIDCGAYAGYSSAYFLSRFPCCSVIALEPNPQSFALLKKNLAPFGDRVKLINAGIWSHACGLTASKEIYRSGEAWVYQVRESEPGQPSEIPAMDIASILEKTGKEMISLLKMDIEGAEAVVFSKNYRDWIKRVEMIVIELHDDTVFGKASDIFYAAVAGEGFTFSRSGELVIAKRQP
jgi:FkbM family methyltransferase